MSISDLHNRRLEQLEAKVSESQKEVTKVSNSMTTQETILSRELRVVRTLVNELKIKVMEAESAAEEKAHKQRSDLLTTRENVDKQFRDLEGRLSNFVNRDEIANFRNEMTKMATLRDLNQFKNEINKNLAHSIELLEKCEEDNIDMRMITRQFDETICDKVNKAGLLMFKKSLDTEFWSKSAQAEFRLDELNKYNAQNDKLAAMKDRLDRYDNDMRGIVNHMVGDNLSIRMSDYDRSARQFSKFFHEDTLQQRFAEKVFVSDFNNLEKDKASRQELGQTLNVVQNVLERVQAISMMQVELARVWVPQKSGSSLEPQDSQTSKIMRYEYLLRQS